MKETIHNIIASPNGMTRRQFLWGTLVGSSALALGLPLYSSYENGFRSETFIARVRDYQADISWIVRAGFQELGVSAAEIKGKKILLKPNLVEPHTEKPHINTHPLFVRGVAEAFLHLGAAKVYIAEGTGHCRDTIYILEESGFSEIIKEDRLPFVDLNYDAIFEKSNAGKYTKCSSFYLPGILQEVDWIVSLPKLKTHHWTGITLSMKNLFGLMPGAYYGWPKNVLHSLGIEQSLLDITATVKPHFAIVDGIIGMEGDGPIMGIPKAAQVIVMGRNFPAVDATCARIMGIDPHKIRYLSAAAGWLGPIRERHIHQVGEPITSVRMNFALEDKIPAHKNIRI
jgi:uncharacterized protein (DUF362 family)